jgi:secreted trypsin-like serine protease
MKRTMFLVLVFLVVTFATPFVAEQTHGQSRIVGGTNATMAEFPHQVLVLVAGYMCGGSLIAPQYVLTAAHCAVDDFGVPYAARTYTVYAGLQNMGSLAKNTLNPYFQRSTVSAVSVHPRFDTESYNNDVAVLKLLAPLKVSAGVKVIKIATTADIYKPLYTAPKIATVSGWGAIRYDGPTSNTLRKVQVPMVSTAACNTFYGPGSITNQMVCAGYSTGGKDSCQGDSGGPLIATLAGVPIQIGIVSWGNGCAWARYPGVYTRIPSLYPWIKAQAKLTY